MRRATSGTSDPGRRALRSRAMGLIVAFIVLVVVALFVGTSIALWPF